MSRIVAVASGKGGVGKTWLAVTLGHALARLGRRVLLFDGDLGLANVDVQLGLPAGPDLGGVVAGRYRLAAAVRHVKAAGFDVVPGRSGSGGLALLPPPVVESLGAELQGLAEGYDVVVLDLCAGLERAVRQLAALAATHLVVATDEPTALTDAYAFIKISHRQGRGPEPRIVVNMAQSRAAGERTYATLARVCRNFLKIEPPLAGVVRRDSRVPDAIRHQIPLLVRHPNSPAACDVEALAQGLTGSA